MRLLKWFWNVWMFGWYGKAIRAQQALLRANETARQALELAKNAREVYRVAPPRYVFMQAYGLDNLHYLQVVKGIFEMPEMRFFLQCCKEDAVADIKRGMPIGIAQKACGWLEGFGVIEAKAEALARAYEAQKAAQNEAV